MKPLFGLLHPPHVLRAADKQQPLVLSANVGAWEGRARTQSVALRNSGATFIGGGRQLCVPGLTWQQIGLQSSGTLDR
jgi:hypothetical protein